MDCRFRKIFTLPKVKQKELALKLTEIVQLNIMLYTQSRVYLNEYSDKTQTQGKRQRERRQTEGPMSRTMAVHAVHFLECSANQRDPKRLIFYISISK